MRTRAPKPRPPGRLADSVLWRPKFLQMLLETEGNVTKACAAAGIQTAVAYQAASRDPDFQADWEEIKACIAEIRSDAIESAMSEDAINGRTIKRYDAKGRVVEERKERDTNAGSFLLKAYRPAKFREKPPSDAGMAITSLFALVQTINAERRGDQAAIAPPSDKEIEAKALPPARGDVQ